MIIFHQSKSAEDPAAARLTFIRLALLSLQRGARMTVAMTPKYTGDYMVVTYERLQRKPEQLAAPLFRFLDVSDSDDIVAACVARTSFAALSGGRSAGVTEERSFLRKAVVGDWRCSLTPEMNAVIQRELGWTFPIFGRRA